MWPLHLYQDCLFTDFEQHKGSSRKVSRKNTKFFLVLVFLFEYPPGLLKRRHIWSVICLDKYLQFSVSI